MHIFKKLNFYSYTIIFSILILLVSAFFLPKNSPRIFEKSQLITPGSITKGPVNAPVYLVEFSDFQCPACQMFVPIVEDIMNKYEGKILFVYRHFPLPQHPYAKYAAYAFESAAMQGKPWQMYTYLFDHQKNLTKEFIDAAAYEIGLNEGEFRRQMQSKQIETKIEEDISEGKNLGINSTPTFFLNGEKLNLFSPLDLIKKVDEAMEKQNN